VNFYNDLSVGGTEITGAFSNPFEVQSYDGLYAVTLVGELRATSLGRALSVLLMAKLSE